jgi:hypothetical protein
VVYIDHAKAQVSAAALLAQNAIPAARSAGLVKCLPEAAPAAAAAVMACAAMAAAEEEADEAEAPRTPEGSDSDEDVVEREGLVGALVGPAAPDGLAACKL